MSEIIHLESDGVPMDAIVAMPHEAGPHPGVVLLHHQDRFSVFTRDFIERLAEVGYAVIAPDNFHHSDPKLDLNARKSFLRDAQIANDIAISLEWLRAQENVEGGNLAILGHCQGGRMAFLGASVWPDAFKAAIVYYSGNMFSTRGDESLTPFQRLKDIVCPVMGFFGALDQSPSPQEVDRIEAELARYGVEHQFFRYGDAGHGFCDFSNPKKFNKAAADDAWTKTIQFLERTLRTKRQTIPS